MNEMLANHYFLTRDYNLATYALEEVLVLSQNVNPINKKLVICYIQTGKTKQAFDKFFEIVCNNPNVIIDTDPEKDYCPCPELIYEYENDKKKISEFNRKLILGMLWLYCDTNTSINYFSQIPKNKNYSDKINKTLSILTKNSNQLKVEN